MTRSVAGMPGSNGMSVIAELDGGFGIGALEPAAKMRTIGKATLKGNSGHRFGRIDQ